MQENDGNVQNTTAAPIVDQAKDTAKQAVQQGQDVAGKAVETLRGQMRKQITTQKDNAASSIGQVADAVFLTSKHLRDQGQNTIGDYSDRLATGIFDMSTYLERHELDELATEVSAFARRQPTLFIASAVVLGVFASRFLKSSSHREAQSGNTTPNTIAPYNEEFAASQLNSAPPVAASTVPNLSNATSDPLPNTFDTVSGSRLDTVDADADLQPDAIDDLRNDTTPFSSSGNMGDTPMSGETEVEDVTVIMSRDALDDDDDLLTQSSVGTRSSNVV